MADIVGTKVTRFEEQIDIAGRLTLETSGVHPDGIFGRRPVELRYHTTTSTECINGILNLLIEFRKTKFTAVVVCCRFLVAGPVVVIGISIVALMIAQHS